LSLWTFQDAAVGAEDRDKFQTMKGAKGMTMNRWTHVVLVSALVAGWITALPQNAQTQDEHPKLKTSAGVAKNRVAIQVSENDKAQMDLALNNAKNIIEYYENRGERVVVEIVTYGPGLHMLRVDTSPVKDRIPAMTSKYPNLTFMACGNTQTNQGRAEGKPVALLSEAKVTPSGIVRLIELQRKGYAYIRP
jgi:uncharacterized protein